jgi:formamidopyrimidine-DNA glycosylase
LRLRDWRRFGVVLWKDGDVFRHPCSRGSASSRSASISRPSSSIGRAAATSGIKQLLMNANVMVGVGNIYANEARSGRASIRARARKPLARLQRLVAAVRDVLWPR